MVISNGLKEYGEYTASNLDREPYWPERKLRISITGAGGFIASHIARRLKSEGHYIVASDWKKNEYMSEDMFCDEFHLVDLRVMDNCLAVTEGVQNVFNLPADTGHMGFIQSDNDKISRNMLEAARINGIHRYVCVCVLCVCVCDGGNGGAAAHFNFPFPLRVKWLQIFLCIQCLQIFLCILSSSTCRLM
jgi:GDP-D-mannose 3',5'-epimerase